MRGYLVPTEHAIRRWQTWTIEPNPERARRRLLYSAHHGEEVQCPQWLLSDARYAMAYYVHHRGMVTVLLPGRRKGRECFFIVTVYKVLPRTRFARALGVKP